MKTGFTQTIYAISTHSDDPSKPTEYGVEQIMDLAKKSTEGGQGPIKFDLTKFHKSANGDIQTVNGASTGLLTMIPVGGPYMTKDGGSTIQWCWTTEDMTQPGGDIVITLTDEFGTPQLENNKEKKEAVNTGIPARSFVLVLFKEGDQNGEVVLAITPDYGIVFASMQEDDPFTGPSNSCPSLWSLLMRILPPIPAAMAGTVDDADISQV